MSPPFPACMFTAVFLAMLPAHAGKELEGIAARSVHLGYQVPEGEWFHVEARVDETQSGTYVFAAGVWHPANRARFTGDGNPVMNIDGGVRDGNYFLSTGGATTNAHTQLRGHVSRESTPVDAAAPDLPAKPEFKEEPQP